MVNTNSNGKGKGKEPDTTTIGHNSPTHADDNEIDGLDLSLSLAPYQSRLAAAALQPPPATSSQVPVINPPPVVAATSSRPRVARRNPNWTPPPGKSITIPPPYPWSDEFRATVRSLKYLLENEISSISGDVQCKNCEQRFAMELDLEQSFGKLSAFITGNRGKLYQRATKAWMSPEFPKCGHCGKENSVKPVIAEKKRKINWLFLLLGEMLGCCTMDQIKYLCKHTNNHRTGAKDRIVFLAYMELCSQLDPEWPIADMIPRCLPRFLEKSLL